MVKSSRLKVVQVREEHIILEVSGPIFLDPVFEALKAEEATLKITRGTKHTLTFMLNGQEESFSWGPHGSDKVPESHIRIKTEVLDAIKEAGINVEVATFMKPIDVRVYNRTAIGRMAVVAVYPKPIEKQEVEVRFSNDPAGQDAATAYGKALLRKVPKELLDKESFYIQKEARAKKVEQTDLPEDYVDAKQKEENKRKYAKNRVEQGKEVFKQEFDAAQKLKQEAEAAEELERQAIIKENNEAEVKRLAAQAEVDAFKATFLAARAEKGL